MQLNGKSYAGIGARITPENILHTMCSGAMQLAKEGYLLRSGHADGADQAFQMGANKLSRVYLPWPSYNQNVQIHGNKIVPENWALHHEAAIHHPIWDELSQGVQKLLARNVAILLGSRMDDPVDFVICWTPEGKEVGGTGHAMRIAEKWDIPVYNLGKQGELERLSDMLWP